MNRWLRISLSIATLLLVGAVVTVAVVTGGYFYVEPGVPDASTLRDVRFQIPLSIYSRDRRLMAVYGVDRRAPVPYDEIPEQMVQAFLSAEDDRFFEHSGIDYAGILRGAFVAALNFVTRSDSRVPGGSTITQQVSRTANLMSRERTLVRKFKEAILAFRIEDEFTKEEILGLFLNTTFFGQRANGVAAAAQTYFNKRLSELTLGETAIIAGIPQGPSIMNPYNGPERAAERRSYVLRRMRELGFITEDERRRALAEPIVSQKFDPEISLEAEYVADMAYEWCKEKFGKDTCDAEGLTITTTLDSRLQRAANGALRDALDLYDRNHGYRGPVGHIDLDALGFGTTSDESDDAEGVSPAATLDTVLGDYPTKYGAEAAVVVGVNDVFADVYMKSRGFISLGFDSVSWAHQYITDDRQGPNPKVVGDVLAVGDIVRFKPREDGVLELDQVPDPNSNPPYIQGAFVSLDPMDGAVVALVGGYGFEDFQFNRVTMAYRQPGSSFKPFFYLSALAHGYTLASIVNDVCIPEYSETLERRHCVENVERIYHGEVPLRFALKHSLNAAADRVIRDIGASYAANFVERFGFDPLPGERNASLALGSIAVTPLQLANGYAILANGGYAVGIRKSAGARPAPYFVDRVVDAEGHLLYDAADSVEMVCPEPATDEAAAEEPGESLITDPTELYPWPMRCAERVESAQRIYLITDVLKDVIRETSGVRAGQAFPNRRDLAGKTGTTNGPRDALFAGFNGDIVAVARVGFDDDTRELGRNKLGTEQGGRTAIPAWIDFMKVALDGQDEHDLPLPPGVLSLRVNPETGKQAADCSREFTTELFLYENQPERESDNVCFSGEPISRGAAPAPADGESGTEPPPPPRRNSIFQ